MTIFKALDIRTASIVTVVLDPDASTAVQAFDHLDQDLGDVSDFVFSLFAGKGHLEFTAGNRKVEAMVVEMLNGRPGTQERDLSDDN